MRVMLALLMLALSGCAMAQPPFGKIQRVAKSLGIPGGTCSGTAVGRYVILTATHCVADGASAITIDGKLCAVWKIVNDGRDHALLTIDHKCPQKHVARWASRPAVTGDAVYVYGNPGEFEDLLRSGQVAGIIGLPNEVADEMGVPRRSTSQVFTGSIGRGDSGAGVFNKRGELVGVVSFGTGQYTFPPHLFCGMLPMNFKREFGQGVGL